MRTPQLPRTNRTDKVKRNVVPLILENEREGFVCQIRVGDERFKVQYNFRLAMKSQITKRRYNPIDRYSTAIERFATVEPDPWAIVRNRT